MSNAGETIVTAYTEDGCSEIYEIEVRNTPESVLAVVAGGVVVAVGGALGVRKYKGVKKA